MAGYAHAQQRPADEKATAKPPQSTTLEEVVVTATRREENLQNVPISVLAFDAAKLADRGVNTLQDIERFAPNVLFAGRGATPASGFITMRGLFDSPRNIGSEQRVGIYTDGIYLGRTYNLDQSVLGLQRVEVLRGPQGTLFGKATPAGAISLTTREPTGDFESQFALELGNFDYRLGSALVGGGIASGVAGWLGVEASDRDGYTHDPNFPNDTFNGAERYAARGALRFDIGEQSSLTLRGDFQRYQAPTAAYEDNLDGEPKPYRVNYDFFSTSQTKSYGGAAEFDHTTDGGYQFISLTGYRFGSFAETQDLTPTPFILTAFDETLKQYSQEFRLVSPRTDRFDFVAGAFYMHQEISTGRKVDLHSGQERTTIDYAPGEVNAATYALYANGNYRLNDLVELTAGTRVTRDEKDIVYNLIDELGIFLDINDYRDTYEDTQITPRAGVNLHFTDNVMGYVSYARGYTGGGWNADFVNNLELRFKPEFVDNYELGLRSTWFDERLVLNSTLFWGNWTDVQVLQFQTLPTGQVILVLSNAAEAESKGVELELTYRITDGLSITTNAAYNDAKYTRFPDGGGPGIDYDGNRLIFAPQWTAYAALEYRLPVGARGYASFLADYSYTDENYFSPNNLPAFRTPAFDEVNARVTWAPNEHWELAAWVKNVTDAVNIRSHQIGFTGNEVFTYNPPRMYGLKATYRF